METVLHFWPKICIYIVLLRQCHEIFYFKFVHQTASLGPIRGTVPLRNKVYRVGQGILVVILAPTLMKDGKCREE